MAGRQAAPADAGENGGIIALRPRRGSRLTSARLSGLEAKIVAASRCRELSGGLDLDRELSELLASMPGELLEGIAPFLVLRLEAGQQGTDAALEALEDYMCSTASAPRRRPNTSPQHCVSG